MKIKDFFTTKSVRLKQAHPIFFCLLTALSCEFLFQHFIPVINLQLTFGRIIIVFLSLYIIQEFSNLSMPRFRPQFKDLMLVHLLLIFSVCILWFGRIFGLALISYLQQFATFKDLTIQTLHFAIPFTCGAMLVSAVKGLNYGFVFSICFAIIVGFYLPEDFLVIPFVFVTSLIAALSLENFRSRAAYLKVGLKVGLIAIPFSLVSLIIQDNLNFIDISFRIVFALLGGFFAVILAASITPILESIGGYVTDLRLIEMSTLDHPLLKMLSVQAPGTWNHSMVVGMMVESAADSINANPILARVGAYFHDIGKTKKPMYFVENQMGEQNRHNKLSPSMSALIIKSHVKDGIEMAEEHRLPRVIIDLIEQHHGTSLIEYFYNKACRESENAEESVEIDESLYSYNGPKPQTREAGILMLADVTESSARVLSDVSPDRIQMHVQKIINRVFVSGQLEESDLTLRDLHKIAKSFTRVLNSIYHQRIAYDEPVEKNTIKSLPIKSKSKEEYEKKATEQTKIMEHTDLNRTQENQDQQKENQEPSPNNLKRLGIEDFS